MRLARIVHIVFALALVAFGVGIAVTARATNAGTDVSGAWSARFALACSGSLMQSSNDLSGSVDCGSNIRVNLSGTFDRATGTMTLTGDFADVPVTVDGTASHDGTSLAGTWSAPPFVMDGPFVARRENTGSATDLSGFWIISVQHIFSDSCTADLHQNASELSGTVACAGGPSGAFTGAIDAGSASLTGRFGAYESLRMSVGFSDESFYGLWTIDPSGPGGVLEGERLSGGTPPEQPTPTGSPTRTPTRTPTSPAGLAGDANCDGTVNSIDAAIVLQYGAGVLHALACPANADVNGDRQVNSVDAALILQYAARLLDHLPV